MRRWRALCHAHLGAGRGPSSTQGDERAIKGRQACIRRKRTGLDRDYIRYDRRRFIGLIHHTVRIPSVISDDPLLPGRVNWPRVSSQPRLRSALVAPPPRPCATPPRRSRAASPAQANAGPGPFQPSRRQADHRTVREGGCLPAGERHLPQALPPHDRLVPGSVRHGLPRRSVTRFRRTAAVRHTQQCARRRLAVHLVDGGRPTRNPVLGPWRVIPWLSLACPTNTTPYSAVASTSSCSFATE
eukprot:scaffold624_cov402-Prasinococcus_capsulatus_cf.AAC.37